MPWEGRGGGLHPHAWDEGRNQEHPATHRFVCPYLGGRNSKSQSSEMRDDRVQHMGSSALDVGWLGGRWRGCGCAGGCAEGKERQNEGATLCLTARQLHAPSIYVQPARHANHPKRGLGEAAPTAGEGREAENTQKEPGRRILWVGSTDPHLAWTVGRPAWAGRSELTARNEAVESLARGCGYGGRDTRHAPQAVI